MLPELCEYLAILIQKVTAMAHMEKMSLIFSWAETELPDLCFFGLNTMPQCNVIGRSRSGLKSVQVMLASATKSPNNSSLICSLSLCHFYSLHLWGACSGGDSCSQDKPSHNTSSHVLEVNKKKSFLFFFLKDEIITRVITFY